VALYLLGKDNSLVQRAACAALEEGADARLAEEVAWLGVDAGNLGCETGKVRNAVR